MSRLSRFVALALALVPVLALAPAVGAADPAMPVPASDFTAPGVSGSAWFVSVNGIPLAGSNADEALPTASTAKIMTAYVILTTGAVPLTRPFTVNARNVAWTQSLISQDDWVMPVKVGEVFTNQDLLQALLTRSYDNVAVWLADQVPGSEAGFVGLMNATARKLGLTHTHFADVSGVSPQDTSSPADMTRLAQAALAIPAFQAIVSSRTVTLPYLGTLKNIDSLFGYDNRVTGVKTGWTQQAGHTIVFSAKESLDGQSVQVVGTIDHEPSWTSTYADAAALITAAFNAAANVYPLTTREAFVTDLARTLGLSPIDPHTPTFTDVPTTDPDYGYVEAAAAAGWVNGVGGGLFDPQGILTRTQAAKIEVWAVGQGRSVVPSAKPTFADTSSIPRWAWPYVALAQRDGLFQGNEMNDFLPSEPLTVATTAAAISQLKTALAAIPASAAANLP